MTETETQRLDTRRRWLLAAVVVVLLGQMAVAMVYAAARQTPTIDEPVYVGTAVVYFQEHSLRYNPEHPPLGKLILAAGLVFGETRLDTTGFEGDQGALGRRLLYESGNDPWRLMLLARLPVIALTLLFGLVVFAFARELVGPLGGVLALALYAFSPDLIAHGSLATPDVPVAGFLLTSVWLVWRARRRPWLYLPLAAAALGAALATKMNALAALPVVLAFVALSLWRAGQQPLRTVAVMAGAVVGVGLAAVAVVWLVYLVVDPSLAWTPPPEARSLGGRRYELVEWLPFPEPYRDGMRIQFRFERGTWSGYLFGQTYEGGRWYYLPAALLVKTPLGALALWVAGAVAMLAVRRLRPAALYVLVPPAALFAVATTGTRNFGTRYVVFLPMFLAVAAAAVVALRWRKAHLVAAALVVFAAVSSLRTFPYYLPYSNEAFGGPAQTYRHLHDSNVDWGQDLGRLAHHLREKYPGEKVWLVYKGSGVPSYYGIDAADPLTVPPERVSGLLVVSNSALAKGERNLPALVDGSQRIDDVGHSITIFRRP